jgi:hypothetical protein
MVIRIPRRRPRGVFATECVIALAILAAVMLPMSFSLVQESKLCRAYYYRAVALEIVDGEMETLAAGEWRAFPQGRQVYRVQAASATNLPAGEFILTLGDGTARLSWTPKTRRVGGEVVREIKLK